MGRKAKYATVSNKKSAVSTSILATSSCNNTAVVVCASLIVATLAYALYQPFSIGAHLAWVYSSSTPIEVERYVMNNSISYQ